jgi:hypothetical protein
MAKNRVSKPSGRRTPAGIVLPEGTFDDFKSFSRPSISGSGRWATAQLKRLVAAGQDLNTTVLRTADTLRHEDWKFWDDVVQNEALIRLVGVADLIGAGLTKSIPNSLGKTVYEYEKITFMDEAEVSLDGVSRTANDVQEFSQAGIPLPITHKDFFLNLRQLTASRNSNTPLDTVQAATAGRVVAEKAEKMLFQGGKTFGGLAIYGYTNFPQRNIGTYTDSKLWSDSTKVGTAYVADTIKAMTALSAARQYGPYGIYVDTAAGVLLENDYVAAGGNNPNQTIRQRLEAINNVSFVHVADQMPAGHVVFTQLTSDNAVWVQGEPLQVVQWDEGGGFTINFKAFQIAVPLFRVTAGGRSGVYDMYTP